MIQRSVDDRRDKKIKVDANKRLSKRRKDDIANIKAYYVVLCLSVFIFISIGLLSLMKGF